MAGYLDQYGAGDERRIKIIKTWVISLVTLAVLGGLAFNLVPLCTPGRPVKHLFKAAAIIILIFAVVLGLALGSAVLYGLYIEAHRGG